MKAKLSAGALNTMLKTANKFIDKKSEISDIRGKIALCVRDGLFEIATLSCTDGTRFIQSVPMESEYTDDFECVFEAEDGAWTVDAKCFAPIKGLAKKSDVIISADNDLMTVSADGLSFQINAERGAYGAYGCLNYLCSDEKTFGDVVSEMEIDDADCASFKYVVPAMSDDETRPDFMGASIQGGKIVATDGHRLHVAPLSPVISGDFHASILNPVLVKAIADGMKGTLREFLITKENVAICELRGYGFRLVAKSIAGRFPDFTKVFPRPDYVCEINAQAFLSVVKSLCAGWKAATLAIYGTGDLQCVARGKRASDPPRNMKFIGFNESSLTTKFSNLKDGVTKRIGLEPQYIIDALADSEYVQFCTVDEDSPVWFGEYDGMSFGRGAIVMPIQI